MVGLCVQGFHGGVFFLHARLAIFPLGVTRRYRCPAVGTLEFNFPHPSILPSAKGEQSEWDHGADFGVGCPHDHSEPVTSGFAFPDDDEFTVNLLGSGGSFVWSVHGGGWLCRASGDVET